MPEMITGLVKILGYDNIENLNFKGPKRPIFCK